MKKLLTLLLALCLMLSLIACGKTAPSDDTSSTEILSDEFGLTAKGGNPSFGEFNKNSYKNEFLRLSINFSDDWVFFSREELLAANNITAETEKAQQEAINKAETVYLFYGQEINTFNTIKISAKKTSGDLSMEDALLKTQNETVAVLEKMNATDIKSDISAISIGKRDISASKIVSTFVGQQSEKTEFLIRSGDYLITVSINAYTKTSDIISMFGIL